MIAHEHIQKITWKDLFITTLLAAIASGLTYLGNFFLSPSTTFLLTFIFLALSMNLAVYLTKKSIVATISYLAVAFLTFNLNDIGILGWKKVLIFLLAALIFEIIYIILKINIHNLSFDIILGTSISIAFIPLLSGLSLAQNLTLTFPPELVNLILLAFVAAILSATITSLIWNHIKLTKPILKLESWMMSLTKKL